MRYHDPLIKARHRQVESLQQKSKKFFKKRGLKRKKTIQMVADFSGKIVLPNSPDYDKDRALDNPYFNYYPSLIAYCNTYDDVAFILQQAQAQGASFRIRGGGHSTAGFSEASYEWVLDISALNSVRRVSSDRIAIGGGASLQTVLNFLAANKLQTVTGGCPSVGYGGYMQGGGYGFTSRQFGMSCDTVTAVTVMLADGSIVVANDTVFPELFWAVRGGTGNNFGVLLEAEVAVWPDTTYQGLTLVWKFESAAEVLATLQNEYMTQGHPQLGYQVLVCSFGSLQDRRVVVPMMYSGPGSIQDEIKSLTAIGNPETSWQGSGGYNYCNDNLLSKLPSPPNPLGKTLYENKRCGYMSKPLSVAEWQVLLDYLAKSPREFDQFVIEPYGGKVAKPGTSNAFMHRNEYCDFICDVFWEDPSQQADAQAFLDGFINYSTNAGIANPYLSGRVYQDYPIQDLDGWQNRYWDRYTYLILQYVKTAFDRGNVFDFPQSIVPAQNRELPALKWPFATQSLHKRLQED